MSIDPGAAYAVFYVLVLVPAALYGLYRTSLIPPTNTYDDETEQSA